MTRNQRWGASETVDVTENVGDEAKNVTVAAKVFIAMASNMTKETSQYPGAEWNRAVHSDLNDHLSGKPFSVYNGLSMTINVLNKSLLVESCRPAGLWDTETNRKYYHVTSSACIFVIR